MIITLFGILPNILYKEDVCTVTKLNGETEEIGVNELMNIIESDVITFENEYKGAKISGEGTIDEIKKGSSIGTVYIDKEYYTVEINNVEIEVRAEICKDFRVGDKVRYEGIIDGAFISLEVDQAIDLPDNPIQNIFHVED